MKKTRRALLAFSVLMSSVWSAQAVENKLVAFDAAIPASANNSCSGSDAMKLLGSGSEMVGSIECEGVSLTNGRPGITLTADYSESNPGRAVVRFTFSGAEFLNVTRLHLIGVGTMKTNTPATLTVNGKPVDVTDFGELINGINFAKTKEELAEQLKNPSGFPRVVSSAITPAEPLKELTITINPSDKKSSAVQLLGLRIYYDGTTPNGDFSTVADMIVSDDETEPEYFDIAGIKLSGEPATGLYIVRKGDKVEKRYRR